MKAPTLTGTYKVSSQIHIEANQQTVWEVISDFASVYTWAPSVQASRPVTKAQTDIGAGRYCKLDGFGEIEEYITFWQTGEGFVYDVTPLGPVTEAFSSWWLTKIDDKITCLDVVLSYEIRFGLFGSMMHKLVVRKKLEESLPQTLMALKTRVETGKLARPLINEASVT